MHSYATTLHPSDPSPMQPTVASAQGRPVAIGPTAGSSGWRPCAARDRTRACVVLPSRRLRLHRSIAYLVQTACWPPDEPPFGRTLPRMPATSTSNFTRLNLPQHARGEPERSSSRQAAEPSRSRQGPATPGIEPRAYATCRLAGGLRSSAGCTLLENPLSRARKPRRCFCVPHPACSRRHDIGSTHTGFVCCRAPTCVARSWRPKVAPTAVFTRTPCSLLRPRFDSTSC